jgi:hypothetical protein
MSLRFEARGLGFVGPAASPEAHIERVRSELPGWEAILAMCHDGREWKVGAAIASMVSTKIWFSAMPLGLYDLAEETIERCLKHPEPLDRGLSADLPTKLLVTRFIRDRTSEAARALIEMIDCGIYRPGQMARSIYYDLSCWLARDSPNGRHSHFPVTDEARALAVALGVAMRAGKRHLKSAEAIQTWEDFVVHTAYSAGFEFADAKANSAEPAGTSSD